MRRHFAALDLDVDLHDEVRELDLAVQQKIEIARAVFRKPRILLLDEPTSSLSGGDIDWLGAIMSRLRAEGVTIVFISHRMPEVRRFCDRLTVLRNGRDIATRSVAEVADDEVIRMIIGRSLAQTFPPRPADRPRARRPRRDASWPPAASRRRASPCTGRDPGRRRSCRAWVSSSCSSPASA